MAEDGASSAASIKPPEEDRVNQAKSIAAKIAADRDDGLVSSFGLRRLWKKVDISCDSCILPESKLAGPSPSAKDGVPSALEADIRYFGSELIQAASILLKLPQVAAATGQILYHKYIYSKSLVRSNFEVSCVFCSLT